MKFELPFYTTTEVIGEDMEVQFTSYPGGSPKVVVMSHILGPYASLGKPSFPLLEGNKLILDDSLPEYKKVINSLIADKILQATGEKHPSGYNQYGVYEFIGS